MQRRRRQVIEKKAVLLLRECGVSSPPVPVKQLAAFLGILIREEPSEEGLSGMLFRERARSIIGVNSLHSATRQRFTIAHELGHFCVHDGAVYLDGQARVVHRRDATSALGTEIEEIEANWFAASLLMPADFIWRDISDGVVSSTDLASGDEWAVEDLAGRYEVSPQAMTLRLVNLGYVPSGMGG